MVLLLPCNGGVLVGHHCQGLIYQLWPSLCHPHNVPTSQLSFKFISIYLLIIILCKGDICEVTTVKAQSPSSGLLSVILTMFSQVF